MEEFLHQRPPFALSDDDDDDSPVGPEVFAELMDLISYALDGFASHPHSHRTCAVIWRVLSLQRPTLSNGDDDDVASRLKGAWRRLEMLARRNGWGAVRDEQGQYVPGPHLELLAKLTTEHRESMLKTPWVRVYVLFSIHSLVCCKLQMIIETTNLFPLFIFCRKFTSFSTQ